jgi:hypothetical protein
MLNRMVQGCISPFSNVGNLGERSADILVGFGAFVNPRPTRMPAGASPGDRSAFGKERNTPGEKKLSLFG